MSLEFLRTSCDNGDFVVYDLRLDQEISRGPLDNKQVIACTPHTDGTCVVILDDGERTFAALADVNRDIWWQRPDGDVRFFGIDHAHDPVGLRLADGSQVWFRSDDGAPTEHVARVNDGCCCS